MKEHAAQEASLLRRENDALAATKMKSQNQMRTQETAHRLALQARLPSPHNTRTLTRAW